MQTLVFLPFQIFYMHKNRQTQKERGGKNKKAEQVPFKNDETQHGNYNMTLHYSWLRINSDKYTAWDPRLHMVLLLWSEVRVFVIIEKVRMRETWECEMNEGDI